VGLPPEVALALSLAVRARQCLLGVPALVWWWWAERPSAGGRSTRPGAAGAGGDP
jgi:hypothetical protein